MTLNSIAELRRAKETAEFFGSLPRDEQHECSKTSETGPDMFLQAMLRLMSACSTQA